MNHFELQAAARRYAQGRPYFHPVVVEKIRQHLNLTTNLKKAADIGCGTGLSTLALTGIAGQVIGIDPSLEMLKLAATKPSVYYATARAEFLPISSDQFELVTVSSAFYWFERTHFFTEMVRTLQPGGWLVIYDNAFENEMVGEEKFGRWVKEKFWQRYPYPTNLNSFQPLQPAEAARWGFDLEETRYHNLWRFSLSELTSYLLSLSNITASIQEGKETATQISQWLTRELEPFFRDAQHEFMFGGPLLYLRLQ